LKLRIASLSLLALCLTLAAVPAMSQTLYSNGPTNGNTDAWTIGFGFIVSDTFTLSGTSTVNGVNFAAWLLSGDTMGPDQVSITTAENGGTTLFNGTLTPTQSGCVLNSLEFDVCNESVTGINTVLNAGTYWLNMQNSAATDGDPVYWDENSGPSSASQNTVGTIPSESFTVLGGSSTSTTSTTSTTTTTSSTGTVPEPSSIMLFGSGILGLAGVLRRKLF
jgi:hypothetical protein